MKKHILGAPQGGDTLGGTAERPAGMKQVMQVLDCFELRGRGVIVAGVNEAFNSLDNADILAHIGTKILVVTPDGQELVFEGIEVGISTSMWDKKNIMIFLRTTIKAADIPLNSTVFTC